jgi:transposase
MLIKDITHLDYQELRQISPEAARRAILQVLKAHNGNVTTTAKILSVSRATIYKAIRKNKAGDLKDGSKAPHRVHNKTSAEIEARILELRKKTRYGPVRLKEELEALDGLTMSEHTIRNILRRNKAHSKLKPHKPHKKGSRPYVDWYQAKAFEIVQIDLKYVVDQKALTLEQIRHFHSKQFPLYQWTAVDVNSRFKLMAYSDQKSWTNGLTFFLWVLSWLRSHGVSVPIVFTVDRGEEFGGKSWLKLIELRKLLSGFGCSIIQNHAASPQENAHVERSHRTDDEEFYIPRLLSIHSKKDFFLEAMHYLYYYNAVRKHSSLQRRSPWEHLVANSPDLDAKIRFVPPILLDNIAVQLGDWSGYHLLAQYQNLLYIVEGVVRIIVDVIRMPSHKRL